MAKLSIVIPCYFNEGNIPVTAGRLLANESNFPSGTTFEYVFVDDGSKDGTLAALLAFREARPSQVKVVKLAGNVGSYNAIVAGLEVATGDCVSVIAADLQDPPELIPRMMAHWERGVKFVIANRIDRKEGLLHKSLSNAFHFLIRQFALPQIPKGGFDFVLFDAQLKQELLNIKEHNTNSLYLLAWMNFETVVIPYVRQAREIGKSRWTLVKKIKLFVDSFVSFSFLPIRLITVLGFVVGLGAMVYGIVVLVAKITGTVTVSGWSSLMLVVLFTSSFQMISLGVLGEYLWRVLEASRKRPLYIIDKVYD